MGRPITAEDLWTLRRVGQPEHIPTTTSVVVPVTGYTEDGKAHSTVFRVERDGTTIALTSVDRSSTAPSPSPTGDRMAFLGSVGDAPAQAYVMRLDGGEATAVTDLPLGVRHVTWVPGRDSLIVAAPLLRGHPTIEATTSAKDERGETPQPIATEDRIYRHWKRWLADGSIDHLFRVDLGDGSVHHLTGGLDRLIGLDDIGGAISISPDGSQV